MLNLSGAGSRVEADTVAAKNDYKNQLNKMDGLSDKVKSLMSDIVDTQNVSTGADLVSALTKSKDFPDKVKALNQAEASELDTHLLSLLIEQHYKTQKMVDKLNAKLDDMDASLKLPNVNVDAKGPTFSMPDFSGLNPFGAPSNGPAPASRGLELDINAPKIAVELDAPTVDIKGPKVAAPTPPSSGGFPSFSFNPFAAPKVDVPSVEVKGPQVEIDGKLPTPFDGMKGPEVAAPKVNAPATPLLDWILNLNPAASTPAPKLPMMIINVATNSVKEVKTGIEHNYTVTAINCTPEELKKMIDYAVTSGAFTKTLKDAGFPNASCTTPCTIEDKSPIENPLKRCVVDVTQTIDKLTVADTNTPAFKSAIGGAPVRFAAALPTVPALPGAPSATVSLPPPPMVILDFSLKSITQSADEKVAVPPTITAMYQLSALNATPTEMCSVIQNAVDCGAFTRALKTAGFPNVKTVGPVVVKDITSTIGPNPLSKTVLEMTQKLTGVTQEEANMPTFKAAMGDFVATAPSMSLSAPNLDEVPLPEVPAFDLNVLVPKWGYIIPGFGTDAPPAPPSGTRDINLSGPTIEINGPDVKAPAGGSGGFAFAFNPFTPTAPTVAAPAVKLPMMIISMVTKSIAPAPAGANAIVHVFEITAINCTLNELVEVIDKAIKSGAMTQALVNSGFPAAAATKPITGRDVTPKENPLGRVIVECTQVIDKLTMADTQSPAFKSCISGQLPSMAFQAANPTLPAPLAPPVVVSVVVKDVKGGPNNGVEVVYAVTAINTTRDGLVTVLDKAIRAGFFTQALKSAGYPNAESKQKVEVDDATPKATPFLTTSLNAPVSAGEKILKVEKQDGCVLGMGVQIANESPRMITAFGSLVLDSPLANSYPSGTKVEILPKAPVILDVTQTVYGVPLADAQKPEFKNAFMDPIAMSVGVSPDLPEMYPLEGPTFDFGKLMSYPMAPFQYTFGAPGSRGVSGGDLEFDMQKSKYPYIIKVSTFSVGPLPFGNGIIHGFLVTAANTNPTQLTEVINGAIKAGYFTKAFRDAGYVNATASEPLDIADDMTSVYYPKENPLCRTVLYCQHRIDNLKADDTKSLAFKSAFGGVVPAACDPESAMKYNASKPIIIIECVMNKCIESSSGRSCVADYTVTAINCSPEMLKMIVDNAVKQGVFTQALKDAGFNNANASETVTVKDSTPKDEKVKTICDVIQIVSGVTPTEGNTPPFGTALGNAVATAPSVSPDRNIEAPKAPLFALPEISIPAVGLPTLPRGTFTIPALFDDGLSHLDPVTRVGSQEKASSLRQPAPGAGGKGGVANAFGLLGGDDGLPKGQGALKTEILPKAGDDLPGLLKENDGPEDDDKYIGADDAHDDDHAVTGHLIYDVYKAVALG